MHDTASFPSFSCISHCAAVSTFSMSHHSSLKLFFAFIRSFYEKNSAVKVYKTDDVMRFFEVVYHVLIVASSNTMLSVYVCG